ncbi:hypothetical protein ACX9NE_06930 [Mycobacterium sp. ML4]
MRIQTALATIAIVFGAALGAAPLAWSDAPVLDGTYRYSDENGHATTWLIRTDCAHGCLAYVTTSPGHGFTAALINGSYIVTRTVPDGVTCPLYPVGESLFGGGTYPVVVRQTWDARNLTGEVNYLETPAPCGVANQHDTFTLTRVN